MTIPKVLSMYITWAQLPSDIAERAVHLTAKPGLATASKEDIMQLIATIQTRVTDMTTEWVVALHKSPSIPLNRQGELVEAALSAAPLN
eukprot:gene2239-33722_t